VELILNHPFQGIADGFIIIDNEYGLHPHSFVPTEAKW
jgi:hypothetical protein